MNEPITTTDPDEPEPGGATIYDTAFVRRCATDDAYSGELLSAREFDSWLAQVKAEALRELLEPIRELAEIGDSLLAQRRYSGVVRVTTRKNGYTETESMIRVSDLEGLLDQIEADAKGDER